MSLLSLLLLSVGLFVETSGRMQAALVFAPETVPHHHVKY